MFQVLTKQLNINKNKLRTSCERLINTFNKPNWSEAFCIYHTSQRSWGETPPPPHPPVQLRHSATRSAAAGAEIRTHRNTHASPAPTTQTRSLFPFPLFLLQEFRLKPQTDGVRSDQQNGELNFFLRRTRISAESWITAQRPELRRNKAAQRMSVWGIRGAPRCQR